MELDDDLFFADISKQISMLIMDDGKDDPLVNYPLDSYQGFSRVNYRVVPPPHVFEQAQRRESKGTGVFIPSSSQPRRKQRYYRQQKPSNHIHVAPPYYAMKPNQG